MQTKVRISKILTPFFLAAYIFSALFSQHFHNHGSGEVFKDFHFTIKKESIKKSAEANSTDCQACHLLYESNSLLPEHFSFSLIKDEMFAANHSEQNSIYLYIAQELSTLRGPPVA